MRFITLSNHYLDIVVFLQENTFIATEGDSCGTHGFVLIIKHNEIELSILYIYERDNLNNRVTDQL